MVGSITSSIDGHVADTAIINYCLSFAGQGKQTSVFPFHLQQTIRSFPFLFPAYRKQTEVAVFHYVVLFSVFWYSRNVETWTSGDMETWKHGDTDMETSNRKRKTEAQAVFLNPFTICSSSKRKFVVRPFVDKETNRSYSFGNGHKQTRRTQTDFVHL